MTHGALIFAHNNSAVDYISLAVFCANQIKKHLGIPVSLVTDIAYVDLEKTFDKVITIDNVGTQTKKFFDGTMSSKNLEWRNFSRYQAYELTPYDKTLVVDSDYIINSSVLKGAFLNDHSFQIYQHSFDLAGWRDTSSFERLNQYSIPFYWATAFVFTKDKVNESFFTLIQHIKENWAYYKLLYSIETKAFRNDFAFSIAIHIMNSQIDADFAMPLPGNMTYILDRDFLVKLAEDKMQFLVEKEGHHGEYTLAKTTGLDVHVMNKESLLRVINGGQGV
jgi:hypothetical protein